MFETYKTYVVVRRVDDREEIIFSSKNYAEAEYQFEAICQLCTDWTYASYDLEER